MITYIQTNLFTSPAQTLVNTVNTVGVMGKGIAKTFKEKYPDMFREYKKLCDEGQFEIGKLQIWRGPTKWVLNFPTKTTWQKPSKLEYIRMGLEKFRAAHEELGIVSISFPPLGCGNGGLDWLDVKPLMEDYLSKLPIQIFIHELPVGTDFIPEHMEIQASIPAKFEEFMKDIAASIYKEKGRFSTLTGTSEFEVQFDEGDIKIKRMGGVETIPRTALVTAWATLQTGILSIDQFRDEKALRYKSYLFPILSTLPYVDLTKTSNSFDDAEKYALILRANNGIPSEPQGNLWQLP